jgi:uncharacterized protein (DUF433 family)
MDMHGMKEIMKKAVFDHVDDEGFLILSIDGEKVALDVTDVLERGILSSKQIKSEIAAGNASVEPAALPISSIQTMIREGHTDDEIAAKYSIEASLVRRFAQPVETEKHYAIAQFLSVPMQTGASTRKLESIISHNLRESGVDPKDVSWEATKQGRNPWKIEARFTRRDQEYKATWMWNLRDNSVVSINPFAKRLLGENASAGTLLFGEEPVVNTSSRAIQAALNGRGPIPPSWMTDLADESAPAEDSTSAAATAPTAASAASAPAEPAPLATPASTRQNDGDSIIDATRKAQRAQAPQNAAGTPIESSPSTDYSAPASESTQPAAATTAATAAAAPQNQQAPASTQPAGTHAPSATTDASDTADATDHSKKRRAAVPSWDDILFGD